MTIFRPALFPHQTIYTKGTWTNALSIVCVCDCVCFTSDAMDLCDLSSHHVVDKEVLSLSCQYHLLSISAKVGRGDRKTLNVHTLKFRIYLTINLNKENHITERN